MAEIPYMVSLKPTIDIQTIDSNIYQPYGIRQIGMFGIYCLDV